MRIIFFVDCYIPSPKSGPKMIHDLGVELHGLGHEVTVLTPSHEVTGDLQVTMEDGLRVVRVKSGRIRGVGKVMRAVEEMRLSGTVWRHANHFFSENHSDLIIFYSPTIFWGALVRKLKAAWRCPAFLILRDIFPQWAVDVGLLRKGLVWRYFRAKEIEQYEAADLIAVESPASLTYFAQSFPGKPYHLAVLYNWMAVERSELPVTNYRRKLGLQDKVVFFYGGNLGLAQDVDNIARLAERLVHHKHIHFLLVGEGTEALRLEKLLKGKALNNLQILPAVGQPEYLAMLSEFDVGLVSLDRRLSTHNLPGKALGYMHCGIPILASINPCNDLFCLIKKNDIGLCFGNGEDDQLAAGALKLSLEPELRARMGKNARQLLEREFSASSAARQITTFCTAEVREPNLVNWRRPEVSF